MPLYSTALTAIVRNEATTITRMLDSVRPYVDRMLVLDTGSTDNTIELARQAGAEVHSFSWCDDFSAARNAILELSPADWNLILDADDVLIAGGPQLISLKGMAPDFVGQVKIQNIFGENNEHLDVVWVSRLLPKAIRYKGIIHEQPIHALRVLRLDVILKHDGYTQDKLKAKEGRNMALLKTGLDQNPADAYLWFQLGQEAQVRQHFEEAEQAFERSLGLLNYTPPWYITLVSSRIFTLKKLGQYEPALHFGLDEMPKCLQSADVHFAIGDLLLDWAASDPSQAAQLLPHAIDAFLNCLDIGEKPGVSGAVAGRGSYLAAYNLALLYDVIGQGEKAQEIRKRYGVDEVMGR